MHPWYYDLAEIVQCGVQTGIARALFLAALVTVGGGTVQAPHPGSGAHPAVPARMKSQGPPLGVSTALPAGAGSSSGCQSPASAGPVARTLVITLAGNGKAYCA